MRQATTALLATTAAAVGIAATVVFASGEGAVSPGWRVVDEGTDTGSRSTGTGVTGSDDSLPVAGRVRILAPPGAVSVSAYVECERRQPGYTWSTGGNQWRDLPSSGQPIVLDLPYARNAAGTGEMRQPTACRWVVSVRGEGGELSAALEVREP